MNIFRYTTNSGKDLILSYVQTLPLEAQTDFYFAQEKLEKDGLKALDTLNTRQLVNKLWEIKISQNRYMYVVANQEDFYILHACKKEKRKAEKFELEKAKKRAIELGKELGKKFV